MKMKLRWIALLCALLLALSAVACKQPVETEGETDPAVTETETEPPVETETPPETADLVETAKTEAAAELRGYVHTANYQGGQKALVEAAITAGLDAIDAAQSVEAVMAALSAAKIAVDAIEKQETPAEQDVLLQTDLVNGRTYRTTVYNVVTLDAKDGEGKAISPENITVSVNGSPMTVKRNDQGKIICLLMLAEGANTVTVTAKSGDVSKTVTYNVIGDAAEDEVTVTIAVEAFTAGLGYLVIPTNITLDAEGIGTLASHFKMDADTMHDRMNGAYLVAYALESRGHAVTFDGTLDKTFALSSVSNVDASLWNLSDDFRAVLEENGYTIADVVKGDTLSEKDIISDSGWMYSVNGEFLEDSLSAYKPQNGDILRVQYTLARGWDIGGAARNNFFERVDRDKLTALISEAHVKGIDATNAMEAIAVVMASQKSIDDAYETLSAALGRPVSGITVESSLMAGHVYSEPRLTLDVVAKNKAGKRIGAESVTVLINGKKAKLLYDWDDKAAYAIAFEGGENTVTVTATYEGKSETVTYKVFHNPMLTTTVTVAVEGFTAGIGYVVKPISLTLDQKTYESMASYFHMDAANMRSSVNGAYLLVYALEKNGYSTLYEGELDGGFLAKGISGIDTDLCNLSGDVQAALEKDGYVISSVAVKGTLGQYDITSGAAWTYAVNGVFVGSDISDYKPQNGDVLRMCFTLANGADVGAAGDENYFEKVDREALTVLVSEALASGVDATAAIETLIKVQVGQKEINGAYEALAEKMKK